MKLKFRADAKDIVIFLIFCVVLFYFIMIAVVNIHSFADGGQFEGFIPTPGYISKNGLLIGLANAIYPLGEEVFLFPLPLVL